MFTRIVCFTEDKISNLLTVASDFNHTDFKIIYTAGSYQEFSHKVIEVKPEIVIFQLTSPIFEAQNFFADLAEAEFSPILLAYIKTSDESITYSITSYHNDHYRKNIETFFISALQEEFSCQLNYIGDEVDKNNIMNVRLGKLEKNEYLMDILRGVTKKELAYYKKQTALNLKENGYYLFLWDLLDIEYVDHDLNKNIYYLVGEKLCEECQTVLNQYNGGEVFYCNPTLLCIIINDISTNSRTKHYQTFIELIKKLNSVLNCKTAIRYRSQYVPTIENIRLAYDSFHEVKLFNFFCRESDLLTPELIEKADLKISHNEIDNLLRQIKDFITHNFTDPQLVDLLEELFLKRIKPSLNYHLYFYCYTSVYAALREKFGSLLKNSLLESHSPLQLIYSSIEQKFTDFVETLHLLRGELSNRYMIKNPVVLQVIDFINEHYSEDFSLNQMAETLNINPSYLSQIFTKEMGISFKKYLITFRIQKAKEMLESGNDLVYTIAAEVGFFEAKHFSKTFKKATGFTPLQYKKQFSRVKYIL